MLKFIIKNIFLEWIKLEKNQSFLNEYFKEYDKYDLSEIKSEKHQKRRQNLRHLPRCDARHRRPRLLQTPESRLRRRAQPLQLEMV